jgi:periplasmic copper chaperone A
MLSMSRAAVAVALVLAASAAAAHEIKVKDFEFIHPWTREPAQGVKDVPVYLVVRNTGSEPDRILAVSSPLATKAELRASGGAAQLQGIEVRPNELVELTPDGPHIMLLGLKEALEGYQYFPMWVTFERAGNVEIEVYVEEPN